MPPHSSFGNNSLRFYGFLTAAVYLLTVLFYLKGPQVHSRTARELFAWFICLALLFLFWRGYQQIGRAAKPPNRTIVGFAVVFCLLAFLVFPFHSTDVFGYIDRGWQQVHYGEDPYLRDWHYLRLADMSGNATLIDNSLHSLLIHIFENIARVFSGMAGLHSNVDSAIKFVLRGGLLVFVLYQWWKMTKNLTTRVFIEKSSLILFVLICVASSKFNAWYLGMILPLALLMEDEHWLRRLVVLITAAELLSLTFFKQAYMLNYFAMIVIPAWIVFRQERKRRKLAGPATGLAFGEILPTAAD